MKTRQLSTICIAFFFCLTAGCSKSGEPAQRKLAPPAPTGDATFKVETVAEGLNQPWSLAFLPNGVILVAEKPGAIRIIRDGTLSPDPVANVPATYDAQQGGFFDVLADPNFATNATIYLSFAYGQPEANATRVIRADFDGAALSNIQNIFTNTPTKPTPVHYGGRMAFLPDGSLLVSTGDGFDFREEAQNLESGLGKIIRINTDGAAPDDNPFLNQSNAKPEVWSYGHRNTQGLARDPVSGVVYAHEHGPQGGDEINIIEPGKNYGWPLATYGVDYSGAVITPFTAYDGTQQPIYHWTPSIAPSGLAVYHGDLFPDWDGDLLVGALAGQALHYVDIEDGVAVSEARYLTDLGVRIRDVRIGPDGAIYVTTDGVTDGKILRLIPAK